MMGAEKTRRVVITGATRGLGRAMADEFIRRGHTVAGCGRSPSMIENLARQYPAPHRFDVVDVADDVQVADWTRNLLDASGAPDLVLNNAALANPCVPLWEVPPDEFSDVIDVNIKGVYHVIRHFVPAMIERGTGVIVNFSSEWGRSTSPEVAPYCTTKWAIEGLTRALAQELPNGLATVAYSPGIIDTDMLRSCFGDAAAGYPDAARWARRAAPFFLAIGADQNGQPLTVH